MIDPLSKFSFARTYLMLDPETSPFSRVNVRGLTILFIIHQSDDRLVDLQVSVDQMEKFEEESSPGGRNPSADPLTAAQWPG